MKDQWQIRVKIHDAIMVPMLRAGLISIDYPSPIAVWHAPVSFRAKEIKP